MSGTFEKLMKNRDYWRDEAKAGWAKIEALEAENEELRWAKDEAMETELKTAKRHIKELTKRKAKEARDRVAREVSQLNIDIAAWSKRQEDNAADQELNEAQEVATFNELYFDPSTLKIEVEGTASQEVFDLIMGKQPEQELREITMVAKIVDDKPAHEAARPPRRTRRRVRRYRRWPR